MTLPEIECDYCGELFPPKTPNSKYCNHLHRGAANQEKIRARKREAEYVDLDQPIDSLGFLRVSWNNISI